MKFDTFICVKHGEVKVIRNSFFRGLNRIISLFCSSFYRALVAYHGNMTNRDTTMPAFGPRRSLEHLMLLLPCDFIASFLPVKFFANVMYCSSYMLIVCKTRRMARWLAASHT